MKKYFVLAALALVMLGCGETGKKDKEPEKNWDEIEALPQDFKMTVTREAKIFTDPNDGKTKEDSVLIFTPSNEYYDYFFMYEPSADLAANHYPNIIDYAKKMVNVCIKNGQADQLPIYQGRRVLPYSYMDQKGEWQIVWVGMSKLSYRTYGEWEKLTHVVK